MKSLNPGRRNRLSRKLILIFHQISTDIERIEGHRKPNGPFLLSQWMQAFLTQLLIDFVEQNILLDLFSPYEMFHAFWYLDCLLDLLSKRLPSTHFQQREIAAKRALSRFCYLVSHPFPSLSRCNLLP